MIDISQSLIKEFFFKGEPKLYCPKYIHDKYIAKTISSISSESQILGQYFETKCLGCSSFGQVVDDLPRMKQSKKDIANNIEPRKSKRHIRIDKQIESFKSLCDKLDLHINEYNVQVELSQTLNHKYRLVAHLDIFPVGIKTKKGVMPAIIDLKLTGNINSTYPAEFAWGDPSRLDDIQGVFYQYIVQNFDNDDELKEMIKDFNFEFYYFVFDYKPFPESKYIKVDYNISKETELKEILRKTINIIETHDANGYGTYGDYDLCKKCSHNSDLGGDCEDTVSYQTI
jgi:hypothetical protein